MSEHTSMWRCPECGHPNRREPTERKHCTNCGYEEIPDLPTVDTDRPKGIE